MFIQVTEIFIEDVLIDIKKVLLGKAHNINDAAGMNAAIAFIGTFLHTGEKSFKYIHHSRVDLKRFPITKIVIDALTYITHPYARTVMTGDDVKKLKAFMSEVPRVHTSFERHPLQQLPGALCRIVADAAFARYKLEVDQRGYFSVRELSLLALTTEGTVREALTRKDGSRLIATPYPKSVRIEHAEAKRWLSKQPRFRSSGLLPSSNLDARQKLALVAGVEPGATMQQRARP